MVWGCMSAADMYCDILKQSMIPSLRRLGCRAVFRHDNDPKHTSKTTTALLKKLRVKVMNWPSMSPDLNPIGPICGASSNGKWIIASFLRFSGEYSRLWPAV